LYRKKIFPEDFWERLSLPSSFQWKSLVAVAASFIDVQGKAPQRCVTVNQRWPTALFPLLYANATGWRQRVPCINNTGWPCAIDPRFPKARSFTRANLPMQMQRDGDEKRYNVDRFIFPMEIELTRDAGRKTKYYIYFRRRRRDETRKCTYFDRIVSVTIFIHFWKFSRSPFHRFSLCFVNRANNRWTVSKLFQDVFLQIRFPDPLVARRKKIPRFEFIRYILETLGVFLWWIKREPFELKVYSVRKWNEKHISIKIED